MKTSWTKGMNAQQKGEMQSSFAASAAVRARLEVLLQEKIDSAFKEQVSKASYDSPNWALMQADNAGFIRAMQETISLLK